MHLEDSHGPLEPSWFVEHYWQKRPVVIRQLWQNFKDPIDPHELAGLAMEDDMMSRLIHTKRWQVDHGPLPEETLQSLPAEGWMLMVQDVDQVIPSVHDLWDCCRFLPMWLRDDIMVSFAPGGGSVGPHVDNFDVILLQGAGSKTWHIGLERLFEEDYIPDLPLRLLKNFRSDAVVTLSKGDALYLPARFPHHGIVDMPGMTYSLGFRTPSAADIIQHFWESKLPKIQDWQRFSSTVNTPHLERAHQNQALDLLKSIGPDCDEAIITLGRLMTEPQRQRLDFRQPAMEQKQFTDHLAQRKFRFERNPRMKMVFFNGPSSYLFANGEGIALTKSQSQLADRLGQLSPFTEFHLANPKADDLTLLKVLYEMGAIIFQEADSK